MIGKSPISVGAKHGKAIEKESKTIKILGYNFTIGPRKLTIERRRPLMPETHQMINNKQRCDVFFTKQGQSMPFNKNSTILNEEYTQEIRL